MITHFDRSAGGGEHKQKTYRIYDTTEQASLPLIKRMWCTRITVLLEVMFKILVYTHMILETIRQILFVYVPHHMLAYQSMVIRTEKSSYKWVWNLRHMIQNEVNMTWDTSLLFLRRPKMHVFFINLVWIEWK